MNQMQIFENPAFGQVRTIAIEGEPWFSGLDVAKALGYSNTRDALSKHVDDEDKNTVAIRDGIKGNPNMTIINESGLYSLVLSSKLPTAKQFKRWVTSEILPSIRKHGAYMTPETLQAALLNPDTLIQLCQQLKAEQEKAQALTQTVAAQQAQLEQDKPKVIFADAVATSKQSILVGQLAKLLRQNKVEIGQNRLFAWMRENHYLCAAKGSMYNTPTQRAMDMGLFEIKETAITRADGHTTIERTPKVTGKGQQYFINLFLNPQMGLCNGKA